ncbi:hypothetical protein BXZ70DRAFT_911708 [Cristinia sonorae]|uniref:Uncharacterized protein n=1 Tax=Cristinia sonorae TaxID=1940300 RepID=A0A8K0XJG5_9AGAR|nr:hypothetical protein BXZ70DRAFT_911708 [Cristinia sonorae]
MPFSFSKTSIIHPTHATTSAKSLGVRPDLNRLYTGRDYWENKGHHDFSLWKVLSRKNSSSIRVEPEYNKKADGWKVSSVTGGKAGKPFGCLVPNSQVGILRLFIFRYHIARTIALNPLWKEFDENVQFAAKLEAEFYYAVMMAVKEEMRGAKKQKRNVPMHDVRLGALDEWMAFELFTKGDYFEYLQHPEIAVGAKGAVIEDLHEQLKGYITQKAKSIADENYLDSTRWTDPKQREMWYTALHDGGWSISRCKESNGWAGWTELPPLQQGTMDFGPFPSLEVEEWISSVEVPMKPDDRLGSSGNLENNGVSVEESAGEMCEEEGGAVKEGTATQRSVREGDDNLDDEEESMIVKAGYESYSDDIERRGIVNSDDDLFQHFTDPLREPVPAELLPTCISPQLLMLSHGGQQAGFMAQNIALSTGIANGEVPAARNEDIPPSGIPPVADSPGAPQSPDVLLPEDHGEVPAARNEVSNGNVDERDDADCRARCLTTGHPPSGIPPAADSPGAPQPPAVLLPEHHGEVPVARNEDIPPSGIPPAADSPGAPQPPAVLLPEHHGEVPVARNEDIPRLVFRRLQTRPGLPSRLLSCFLSIMERSQSHERDSPGAPQSPDVLLPEDHGEVPVARNEVRHPPSGIPPAADSPGAPQSPDVLLPEDHGEVPVARNESPDVLLPEDHGEVPVARNEDIPPSGIPPAADSPGAPQSPDVLLPEDHGEVPVARNEDIPRSGIPPTMTVGQGLLQDKTPAQQSMSSHSTDTSSATLQSGNSAQATPPKMIPLKRSSSGVDAYPYTSGKKKWVLENPPDVLKAELDLVKLWEMRQKEQETMSVPAAKRGRNDTSLGMQGQGFAQSMSHPESKISMGNINDGPREESHVVEDSFAECESSFGTEKQLEEFHNKSSFREVFPRAPSATGRTDRSTYSSDIPEKDILTASPTQSDDTVSAVPPITHGKGLQFMVVSSKLRNDNMNDSGESEVSVNEEEPAKTGSKVMARGGAKRPRQGRIVAIRRKKNENKKKRRRMTNWLKFVEMVNFLDLEEDFADVEGDDIVHDCSESWALPEMGVNVTDLEVPFTPEDGKDSSTTQQSKALTKSAKAARRSTRKTSKSEYSSLRAAVSNAQDKPTDDPTEQDVAVRGGDEFVEGDDIVHDCSESWALPEMGVNVTDLEVPFTPEDGKDSSTTQQSKALTKSAQAARRSTRKTSKSEYSSLRAAVSNAQDKPTDDPTEQDVAVRGGDEFVEGDDIVHDCSESWALPEMGVNVTDLEVPFTPEDGKDSSATQQSKALTKSAGKTKTFPRASRSGTDGWVESGQSEQTPPSMETLTPQSQSGLHPELITAEQVHSWDAVWRRNQEEQSEWTEESEEELEVERIMSSPPPTEPDPDTTELESGVLSIQTAYDDWFTKWKGRLWKSMLIADQETAGALDDSQGIMLSADAFRRTILDITRKLGLESPADLGSLFMGDSWTLVWKSTGSQVSKVLIWRACYLGSKDKELGKKI